MRQNVKRILGKTPNGLTIELVPIADVPAWLNQHYLKWQLANGVQPEKDFADWLGVNPKTFNHWRNGRRLPSPADCDVLAYHLKDPSIYALAGHPTPDPLLLRIKMEWDRLSDATQAAIGKALGEETQDAEQGEAKNKRTPKR